VAFTVYRAEVFRMLGGYDPDVPGNEDGEFNLRLRKAGYKLLYTPKTFVNYREVSSPSAFLSKMIRYGAARARTVLKYPWSFRPIHVAPSVAVLTLAVLSIGSFVDGRLLQVLLGLIAAYAVCSLVSAIRLGATTGLAYVLALAIAFPMIHLGYGIGFIKQFLSLRRSK
jgi:succinoglycan biosynthesis protein ExoA